MLHYFLIFLVIGLIAGVLGFGGVSGTLMYVAWVFLGLFVILLLVKLLSGVGPGDPTLP